MDREELDLRLLDFARYNLKPAQPGLIEISYDGGLWVNPATAVVDGKSLITFKATNTTALVFLPEGVVVPVSTVDDAVPDVPGPPEFIALDVGQARTYKVINSDTYLEYSVTTKVFTGFTEGVNRPPVIIIKQIGISNI